MLSSAAKSKPAPIRVLACAALMSTEVAMSMMPTSMVVRNAPRSAPKLSLPKKPDRASPSAKLICTASTPALCNASAACATSWNCAASATFRVTFRSSPNTRSPLPKLAEMVGRSTEVRLPPATSPAPRSMLMEGTAPSVPNVKPVASRLMAALAIASFRVVLTLLLPSTSSLTIFLPTSS